MSPEAVSELRKRFERNHRHRIKRGTDPHCVAELLRRFLRELPEPLLGGDLFDSLVRAGQPQPEPEPEPELEPEPETGELHDAAEAREAEAARSFHAAVRKCFFPPRNGNDATIPRSRILLARYLFNFWHRLIQHAATVSTAKGADRSYGSYSVGARLTPALTGVVLRREMNPLGRVVTALIERPDLLREPPPAPHKKTAAALRASAREGGTSRTVKTKPPPPPRGPSPLMHSRARSPSPRRSGAKLTDPWALRQAAGTEPAVPGSLQRGLSRTGPTATGRLQSLGPALARKGSLPDDGHPDDPNLKTITISKGYRGFGFSVDDACVIKESKGAAKEAGVPPGGRVVRVEGTAVETKPDLIRRLRELGPDVQTLRLDVVPPRSGHEPRPAHARGQTLRTEPSGAIGRAVSTGRKKRKPFESLADWAEASERAASSSPQRSRRRSPQKRATMGGMDGIEASRASQFSAPQQPPPWERTPSAANLTTPRSSLARSDFLQSAPQPVRRIALVEGPSGWDPAEQERARQQRAEAKLHDVEQAFAQLRSRLQ